MRYDERDLEIKILKTVFSSNITIKGKNEIKLLSQLARARVQFLVIRTTYGVYIFLVEI